MALFSQKMDEDILTKADFVNFGRDIPQFSLGSDVVKVGGEESGQMFCQVVDRSDISIEEATDISRKEIRISNEHAPQGKMNHERGDEFFGPFRVFLDEFQPGPNVLNMGRIGPDLPIVAEPLQFRGLETQTDDGIDEKVDQIACIGFVNGPPHVHDTVQGRARKFSCTLLEDGKGLFDHLLDISKFFLADKPGQGPIDIPQGLLVNGRQTIQVHDMKEKDQFPAISMI